MIFILNINVSPGINLLSHIFVMANSYTKLIFNAHVEFYCLEVILPQLCICPSFQHHLDINLIKTLGLFQQPPDEELFPWHELQLPNVVVPLHCDLFIYSNLTSLDCAASEKIEVLVRYATQFIILHSKDLETTNAILQSEEDLRFKKLRKNCMCWVTTLINKLYCWFQRNLQLTSDTMGLSDIHAKLADRFEGSYKSTYKGLDGETK